MSVVILYLIYLALADGLHRPARTVGSTECDEEDGTCDDITRELTFKPVTTFDHENHYRYILDIVRPSNLAKSPS